MSEMDLKDKILIRNHIEKQIASKNIQIEAMQKNPVKNYFKIRNAKAAIQAIEEGNRDILNPAVNRYLVTEGVVNKNNYKTYTTKVQGAYSMYNGNSDYGGDICKGVVETRVSFIGGEGLSVEASKPPTKKFLDEFLKYNKLNGSKLLDMISIGELEGREVIVIDVDKKKVMMPEGPKTIDYVKIKGLKWIYDKYTLIGEDYNNIKQVVMKKDDKDEITINEDRFVYVHLGGMEKDINISNSRLHNILTDIENFSRAKYDLRENTHTFGKYIPYWQTETPNEAKFINSSIESGNWKLGTGYAGPAKFSIVEPSGNAGTAVVTDMLNSLKVISLTMGIPIHFMAYPELLSNRATAENLMEVIVAATRKDRLIWEEAFEDLIDKVIEFAVDKKIANNNILGSTIKVKLPIVSIALLKQIIEIWYPLLSDEIISLSTFREMLPGIDGAKEEKFIKKQKEKAAGNSPMHNDSINGKLKQIKETEETEEVEPNK